MTQEAFLAAIVEAPDDDAPRLVFADWLEDHGEVERAEFIRVQCDLARRPADDPSRPALELRERRLVRRHLRTWRAPLPNLKGIRWGGLERGFTAEVTVSKVEAFVAHAEGLFAAAPVIRAHFNNMGPKQARILAGCPALLHLRELSTSPGLGDEGLSALAESPFVTNVTTLALRGNWVREAGAAALASSPHFARLTILDLNEDKIGDQGAAALAGSPHLKQLRELRLGWNSIGPEGAGALAHSPNLANLTALYLHGNSIGAAGMEALARSPHLRRLRTLTLRNTDIGDAGLAALAASPLLSQLHALDLTQTWIGEAGVIALARSRNAANLTSLTLADHRGIGDDAARALAASPWLARLSSLDLSAATYGNAEKVVTAEGLRALLTSSHLAALTDLGLDRNAVGDEGAKVVANLPAPTQLTSLSLGCNRIGPAGATALASAPFLAGLTGLVLYGNAFGDEGARALAASPHLKGLKRISLGSNGYGKATRALLEERFGKVKQRWL
jgi:uncharacterized protein (TIGR02996 family)